MRCFIRSIILLFFLSLVGFIAPLSLAAPPNSPQTFKKIEWEALVPKNWNPLQQYRGKDFSMLADNDPQVLKMMDDLRKAWDEAPTVPDMNGAKVKLPGYLVPLDETKGALKEFLLVPYFGACIHTPPPPANQIIYVVVNPAIKGFRSMDAVWVSGTLSTKRQDSTMGISGYRMNASSVKLYTSHNQ